MNTTPTPITLDENSRASNPGGVNASCWRWFLHYPKWPLIWGLPLLGFLLLAVSLVWVYIIPALIMLVFNWFYWRRIKDHFRFGCANPAVVVGVNPCLIAAATDLTHGEGEFPAIKIIKKNFKSLHGQVPKVGLKVAVVSLYEPSPDRSLPRWADFHPRPIDSVSTDLAEMDRVLQSFDKQDWIDLESYLKQVPRPYKPGLYLIENVGA